MAPAAQETASPSSTTPPRARSVWPSRLWRAVKWLFLLTILAPPIQAGLLNWVDPPWTATMLVRALRHGVASGEWHMPDHHWVDLDDLPRAVPVAVLSSEDRGFYQHHGFDLGAIRRAWHRYRSEPGAKLVGGSTLSQQVARNVFLTQNRSWIRKGLEAWYTIWMELLVPKNRILEVYVNIAETGPMTFGFESAAQLWYRKSASQLSLSEAAHITAMLPSPNRWTPKTPHVQRRAAWIVRAPVNPAELAKRRPAKKR